jgi:3-oxoacyl-[acyl-carrier protein] reductase
MSRHVILSGASRGLGLVLARALLDAGYTVSTFSRRPTEFTDELAARPDGFATTCDLSDGDALKAFVRDASKKLGTPWAVVNNAALVKDDLLTMLPDDHIRQMIDVNLTGTLLLTKIALRRMILAREGRVVNISSIVGIRGYRGLVPYAATKAALDGMTRALAREVGEAGITVNSLLPGYLETEMTAEMDPAQLDQIVRRTPVGRLGKPEDCVGALLFLLSDASSFVTGHSLVVDGGITV